MNIQHLWQRKNFTPNDKQREAILHVDNPLFLTAGPGSGKTRVLLWRTLNLIVFHEIKPEEIFLSTFTEKAALQLKEGLKNLLSLVTNETGQPYDISKMSVGTVHSICQKILIDRRFSTDQTRRKAPILLDELTQYFKIYNQRFWIDLIKSGGLNDEETAQRSINEFLQGKNYYSRHLAALNVIKFFNRLSEEFYVPGSVQPEDETLKSLLEMYGFYLYSLQDLNSGIKSVDFSLLQQEAYTAIRAIAGNQNIFKHVIVDEYQDTNPIQERLFFELAKKSKNICVVGDDDQALYRFRGATVENLVEFENRCSKYLNVKPKRIDLDINYRSKKKIVDFYVDFIERTDWKKQNGDGSYRIENKKITAFNKEKDPAVICAGPKSAEEIYQETASFVQELKAKAKIQDYNQVAFLFPYLKGSTRVRGFKTALEDLGIPVYAPRAGRFLEVEEAGIVYGLFFKIFGRPSHAGAASRGMKDFRNWTLECIALADKQIENDRSLNDFVNDKQTELHSITQDYEKIINFINRKKWNLKQPFRREWLRSLASITGISQKTKKALSSHHFARVIERREKTGNHFTLEYIINRVTSVDWNILDLFYQLNAFKYFRNVYNLAEEGIDEGPVCNLGLITQYLAKFMEERTPVLTARYLHERHFIHSFFSGFTYALYRLGETEYEYVDDPFPRGRVPFLTIHQSKGLEFPVVVLGSAYKREMGADKVEVLIRELLVKKGEPLDRISHFDNMRMFYVALSRAKSLTIVPYYKGRGQRTSEPFKSMFQENNFPTLQSFNIETMVVNKIDDDDLGKTYSYTGDYLSYLQCPRNYMLFRKYGFVPSRSQTMFFGNLVHQTIEDLHYLLIQDREKNQENKNYDS
jgi:DNA helicase II / ATP-dependent DNA helicase PcrA